MDAWSRIGHTITAEFSTLHELEEVTAVVLRLLLAAILGAALGIEREKAHKSAGLRTHMLVAMGAALFVLLAVQSEFDHEPLARLLQGVIAGIGFLCAGAILKSERDEQVRGLTTAAGLWMTTGVGLACGLGHEVMAVLATVLMLVVLRMERPVKRWLGIAPKD